MGIDTFSPEQPERQVGRGRFSVERKLSVMHYESDWPPYVQREHGVSPEKKSRYMSDLLNKKIVRELREIISSRMFASIEEVKIFLSQFVGERVTEADFGEMARVQPTITERVGRGKKFIEVTVQWLDPNKDKPENKAPGDSFYMTHINDPWFSVRVIEKQ